MAGTWSANVGVRQVPPWLAGIGYSSAQSPVFTSIPTQWPVLFRFPRNLVPIGLFLGVVAGVTSYLLTRHRVTAAEREQMRRELLAKTGRITDGSITETQWLASSAEERGPTLPTMLLYRYSIAGVTYECAQDVSLLPQFVKHVRIDLPVQVRFDPRNPGNSIVVSESWSGLRLGLHPLCTVQPSAANSAADEDVAKAHLAG